MTSQISQTLIRTCSIWRALEIVGDTPTLLTLEAAWLGVRRFDEFHQRTGLLKALLSNRLKKLVDSKIFERRLYTSSPPRYEYVLGPKGRDLYWVTLMLLRWEQLWAEQNGEIRVTLTHKVCVHQFTPEPACGHCGENFNATEVTWREGPGVGWMAPLYSQRRQQRDSIIGTSLFKTGAQLMGDRWASLIMRSIFTGINRFDDIRRDTAIATNVLSERLAWLVSIGVIRQHQYATSPPRYEYRVRRKGLDYFPALLMLMQWGDKFYVSPEGPPLLLTHKGCNHGLDAKVVCSHCRGIIQPQDVTFDIAEPGSVVSR